MQEWGGGEGLGLGLGLGLELFRIVQFGLVWFRIV
jgi:hypothetical protein